MEKIFTDFEKALDIIGGSVNDGAFAFWTANQVKVFPNLRFVYSDGESAEYDDKKGLIGLAVAGKLIGCEFPPIGTSYKRIMIFFRNYKKVHPLMPEKLTCQVASFADLEALFPFRDELSLAFLLMGKPALSGKYWTRSFIGKTKLVKTFDFDRGEQCYNGVTRESKEAKQLKVLPILM